MVFYIILFIFLFSPKFAFIPVDISFIISAFCLLVAITKKKIFGAFADKKEALLILLLIFVYLLVVEIIAGKDLSSNNYSILVLRTFLEVIIPASVLAYYCNKENIPLINIVVCFITIQFIFLLLMINIDIKNFIFNEIISMPTEGEALKLENESLYYRRGFGIGRNYLSSFAVVFSYFSLFLFIELKKRLSLKLAFLLIMANVIMIMNTRTSLIIEIIMILFFINQHIATTLLYLSKIKIKMHNVYILIFISGCVLLLVYFILNTEVPLVVVTRKWLGAGFAEIIDLFQGKTQASQPTTFGILSTHLLLPSDSRDFLFGTALFPHSDIGYVRYIFYGGLIFSLLIYFTYALFFLNMFNYTRNDLSARRLVFAMAVTLPLVHFKGDVLLINEAVRFFFFYMFYLYYKRESYIGNFI